MANIMQTDIEDLKREGYSDFEINQAVKEIEQEDLHNSFTNIQRQQRSDPRYRSQLSSFSVREDDNLIKWQLELNDILERAEHILRGDTPAFEEGHIIWQKNQTPENNCINEIGVQEIMKRLAMYVNRNTILADYDNKEIHIKVFDFTRELNNLIFMNYVKFGMDNTEKRKFYPMIIKEMEDIVHSAYKRALDGAEKRSLREMISVSQSTATSSQLGNGVTINNQGQPSKERGLLNPLRYVRGKYT